MQMITFTRHLSLQNFNLKIVKFCVYISIDNLLLSVCDMYLKHCMFALSQLGFWLIRTLKILQKCHFYPQKLNFCVFYYDTDVYFDNLMHSISNFNYDAETVLCILNFGVIAVCYLHCFWLIDVLLEITWISCIFIKGLFYMLMIIFDTHCWLIFKLVLQTKIVDALLILFKEYLLMPRLIVRLCLILCFFL